MLLSFFGGGGIQLCKNGQRSYQGNTEAVSDSSIVRDPNGVSLYQRTVSTDFHRINGTCMNSLRYLPCFALLRMHLCGGLSWGLAECAPSISLSPPPPTSLCVHWTSTNSVLLYLFVYLLLSLFHFRGFLSETCKPQKPSGRGAVGLHLCVCVSAWVCVCVCFRGLV